VHRLVLQDKPQVLAPLPAAEARDALAGLLGLMHQARSRALPLMPKSAFAYCHKLAAIGSGESEAVAWNAAEKEWNANDGKGNAYGEGLDAWVRLALRGQDPFVDTGSAAADEFRRLSRALFDPLLVLAARGVPA
jgi:exonuclease V gamma subunit